MKNESKDAGKREPVERQAGRREFLATSAGRVGALTLGGVGLGAAAAVDAAGRLRSANERLGVGVVGLGSRGGSLLQWTHRLERSHGVQVTAVCDLWAKRRESVARRVAGWNGGNQPAKCRTIRELCDRSDVDVVIIATADFQHCYHAALATDAGKDVYVEKPFGCDFEQVRSARDAIHRSGRVVQFGTQSRGAGKYHAAAQFVQSGKLGQVTCVEISEPIFQQRWRLPEAELNVTAEDIDWNEFLCYLPPEQHRFDARHFREFRLFWPFSSGPFCQWMSHRIDLVNLVLGQLPMSAVSLGGVYLWRDGRTNPDTVQCVLEYPGGTLVTYHLRMGNSAGGRGTTFYGSAGTLELESGLAYGDGGKGLVVEGEVSDAGTRSFRVDTSRRLRAKREGGVALGQGPTVDYLGDFFDSVRARRKPIAGVDEAYGQAVACILANQAYRSGCKMAYDATTETIRPAGPVVT